MLKVGIVGSRSRNSESDKSSIKQILLRRLDKGDELYIVSGGCPKGADRFAEELAKELHIAYTVYYPTPRGEGRGAYARACYERNTLIAENCDILLAVWDRESKGTYDTIAKARKLNKPVIII